MNNKCFQEINVLFYNSSYIIYICKNFSFMKQKEFVMKMLKEGQQIHNNNRTSCIQLENYLFYQQLKLRSEKSSSWMCGPCGYEKTHVKPGFKRAFKTLNELEKAKFYMNCVQAVEKILIQASQIKSEKQIGVLQISSEFTKKSKPIKSYACIKDLQQYARWTNVQIEILKKQKSIRICENNQILDLHHFILRKSKNRQKNSIALQSTEGGNQGARTIRMSSNSLSDKQFSSLLEELVNEAQFENLKQMLVKQNKFPKHKRNEKITLKKTQRKDIDKMSESHEMRHMNQQNTAYKSEQVHFDKPQSEFEKPEKKPSPKKKIQEEIVPKQLLQSLDSFDKFTEITSGFYKEKNGNKIRKIFTLSSENTSISQLIQILNDFKLFKNSKPNLESIKLISQLPDKKTKVYKQVHQHNQNKIQFTYFRHFFVRDKINYFLDKSLQKQEKGEKVIQSNISYCLWRIKKMEGKVQLLVEADLSYDEQIKNEALVTANYLGDFYLLIPEYATIKDWDDEQDQFDVSFNTDDFQNQSLQQISQSQSQMFYTIDNGSFRDDNSFLNFGNNKSMKNNNPPEFSSKNNSNFTLEPVMDEQKAHLLHHYLEYALPKKKPNFLKSNYEYWMFEEDWRVTDTHNVVGASEEKIKAQSGVLKLIVQRISKNIFSGKGIMNVSLPVQVFGNDSNLERLSQSLCYAPTFLEKAAQSQSPLDRFVQIVCFGLGCSISYIRMDKPFNPILGQTFQGIIDGCPVYAEQTSHHPPITSLFLKGRGYTVYGSLESKVDLSFNSATGGNYGVLNISFDTHNLHKKKVYFSIPPGKVAGVIYGERNIHIVEKSEYFDEENRLYVLLNWGKNKNANTSICKNQDYFDGEIVKIKEGIDFTAKKFKLKPSHIEQSYGTIFGNWTQGIYFSSSRMFNVKEDLPHIMTNYQPSLASDSRFRKDILIKKQNDLEGAQTAKEELEEIQRRDRKLRKQMHK